MQEKTNVMRKLDSMKIKYNQHYYADSDAISGIDVANALGQNPQRVFKTLITTGSSKSHYAFLIPALDELDLKKAAMQVKEKSMEMLKSKDLFELTGYVHGGCSPIGMKKFLRTTLHITAQDFDTIFFSAGKIGYQVELSLEDLKKVIKFELADLIK
ncbi:MAG: Cys-tRNA(Pro) deacylase [Ignavibacteriales bacterium]